MRMCVFVVSLFVLPLELLAGEVPANGQALMQTSSKLRGSKAMVGGPQAVTPPSPSFRQSRELITGQRYSDDDESCSAEGITPGVCALASLGRWTPPASTSVFSSGSADCDKKESAERLERALMAEIDSALAGNHTGFDTARLQLLEQRLEPVFATLPHEDDTGTGGLGLAPARYLLHQHFLRKRAWYVRGLNPAGDGRKPPGAKEELRSRVAGHLLEVLESRAGNQGLNLKMLAIFVATLEHLIEGDQRERLKQAWFVHGLQPEGVADADTSRSVLGTFMAHHVYTSTKADSGYALTLEAGLEEVRTISRIYGGWPNIDSFIQSEVAKRKALRSSGHLTFGDVAEAADDVMLKFEEVSGAMCRDMEKDIASIEGGINGRVRLADLRKVEHADLFRESEDYLRKVGALDDSAPDGPHLLMPNYMLGPSNCDGTTSFYDLCCPNECEDHKTRLERALLGAKDHHETVTSVVQQRLGAPVPADLLKRLSSLVEANKGQVLIHGRGFADWLHAVFPRECPKPREADFKGMAGDAVPDANTDFQPSAERLFDSF
eukprot:TRINITY_DN7508_c0_g1_i1.p1 TRINITY_DN7508_c0_g1~~TRINITY_DN7508_c0_g1_i1.p1  ORF type:complete len:550 (+),score=103.33 TRINITY_DN7508_c0_g1_i1:49-1698(+)